jgi:glycosyltransferase involved in cell wall biosynthesis
MAASREVCVTVCACTYRRPEGLAALLKGLGEQTFERAPRPELRIIIADNEGSGRVRDICDQFRRSSGIPIEYVHEPQRGISYARNACLARLRDDGDFFTMIDDDEIPDPDWIEQLLLAQETTAADVVQGRIRAELPASTPDWIVQGRYFDWQLDADETRRAEREGYPEIHKARTNNVLVRHAVVRELALQFDSRFALTGGEDIVFFAAIKRAGYRIVYAPQACVRDIVPPERTTLKYLLRMWYRVGCNDRCKAIKRGKPSGSRWRLLWRRWKRTGTYAVLTGAALVIGNLLRGRVGLGHLGDGILLIARGLGRTAGSLGIRYEHYR